MTGVMDIKSVVAPTMTYLYPLRTTRGPMQSTSNSALFLKAYEMLVCASRTEDDLRDMACLGFTFSHGWRHRNSGFAGSFGARGADGKLNSGDKGVWDTKQTGGFPHVKFFRYNGSIRLLERLSQRKGVTLYKPEEEKKKTRYPLILIKPIPHHTHPLDFPPQSLFLKTPPPSTVLFHNTKHFSRTQKPSL